MNLIRLILIRFRLKFGLANRSLDTASRIAAFVLWGRGRLEREQLPAPRQWDGMRGSKRTRAAELLALGGRDLRTAGIQIYE
jgi:hypothetical protein